MTVGDSHSPTLTQESASEITEITLQTRNTFWTAMIVFGAAALGVILGAYLIFQAGTWQIWTVTGLSMSLAIVALIAAELDRRGRSNLGVGLVLGGMLVVVVLVTGLIANIGLLLGLIALIITVMLATLTLSQAWINRAIIAGVVTGLVAGALDLLRPATQQVVPMVETVLPVISVALFLVLFFLVIRQFQSYSLASKLTVVFLTLTVLSVGAVTFFTARTTRAALTDSANQALFAAASQTANGIDNFINTNLNAIGTEAQLPALIRYLSLPPEQRAGSAEEVEVTSILYTLGRKDRVYITSYALLDRQGLVLIDTYTPDIGLDKSRHDYFKLPLQTERPYVSPVKISSATDEIFLDFSGLVRDTAAGEVIGVLRVRYNAGILQQLVVQNTGLAGEQSFGVLLDENYIRLAEGKAPEAVFKSVVPLNPARVAQLQADGRLPSRPAVELATNLPNLEQGLAAATTQPYFVAKFATAAGEPQQAAVVKTKTHPWFMVFVQPQTVFLAPVEAQTRSALLLSVAIAGVVAGSALGLAQLLARPILRLTAVAQQISTGDLTAQARPESSDEIGKLARTFNSMTVRLRQTLEGLERRNEQLYQEITERKQAEEALATERNLLRTLIDNLPDYIYVKDTQSRFVIGNKAVADVMGATTPDDLIEKTDFDFYPKEFAAQYYADEQAIIQSGQALINYEEPLIDSEGNRKWLLTTKVPLRDGQGKVVGLVGIGRDITDQKQAEKERNELIAELEAKNTELERFTYTVSHDLKSPLITIRGFLGMLEQDAAAGDTERMKDDIEFIHDATEKMKRLLNDLLELSRIGRLVNPPQEVSLNDVACEAVNLVAGQIAERGVQVDISPDLPVVFGDRPRLLEVIQNLIDNAVKFMDNQAQPRIEIGARPAGEETVCYVWDNGRGIEPRYQEKVFDLFERLDQTGEGTGIGLALVKRIIETHGGRVWVESKGQGQGSTFCFTLPPQKGSKG